MNNIKKYGPMLIMLLLASAVMVLKGCGGNPDGAKLAGCPSDSLIANAGDKFNTVPADGTASVTVFTGSQANTIGVFVTPLVYQVTDKTGLPRNKICVKFYTDGSFWDSTYTTIAPNPLIVVTDDSGIATVYWSTAPFFTSSPATAGPPAAKGDDQGPYQSFINAYSGPVLDLFTYDVTISGCPATLLGLCP